MGFNPPAEMPVGRQSRRRHLRLGGLESGLAPFRIFRCGRSQYLRGSRVSRSRDRTGFAQRTGSAVGETWDMDAPGRDIPGKPFESRFAQEVRLPRDWNSRASWSTEWDLARRRIARTEKPGCRNRRLAKRSNQHVVVQKGPFVRGEVPERTLVFSSRLRGDFGY
jgi:hypothetical protein